MSHLHAARHGLRQHLHAVSGYLGVAVRVRRSADQGKIVVVLTSFRRACRGQCHAEPAAYSAARFSQRDDVGEMPTVAVS